MNICINPFTLNGFLTIMISIGLIAMSIGLYNYFTKKYTLDRYNMKVYDSDSDSDCDNEIDYIQKYNKKHNLEYEYEYDDDSD